MVVSPSLGLVYRRCAWAWFGTMVRMQACESGVDVCVGSIPLDSLLVPSCGLGLANQRYRVGQSASLPLYLWFTVVGSVWDNG